MKKKILLLAILVIILFMITGCYDEQKTNIRVDGKNNSVEAIVDLYQHHWDSFKETYNNKSIEFTSTITKIGGNLDSYHDDIIELYFENNVIVGIHEECYIEEFEVGDIIEVTSKIKSVRRDKIYAEDFEYNRYVENGLTHTNGVENCNTTTKRVK